MSFKYKCLFILAPVVFALDQLTKHLVVSKMTIGQVIPAIEGYFDIVHYTNSGAAFGLLAGANDAWRTPFFYIVSLAALVIIIAYFIKMNAEERLMPFALALVVGGILGNGLDRIRFGSVTDFLSVHIQDRSLWGIVLDWPAFNLADSAITVAMILLIIGAFKREEKRV